MNKLVLLVSLLIINFATIVYTVEHSCKNQYDCVRNEACRNFRGDMVCQRTLCKKGQPCLKGYTCDRSPGQGYGQCWGNKCTSDADCPGTYCLTTGSMKMCSALKVKGQEAKLVYDDSQQIDFEEYEPSDEIQEEEYYSGNSMILAGVVGLMFGIALTRFKSQYESAKVCRYNNELENLAAQQM